MSRFAHKESIAILCLVLAFGAAWWVHDPLPIQTARTAYDGPRFSMILQHRESMAQQGKGVWNRTIAVWCDDACGVVHFEYGHDYVSYPGWKQPLSTILSTFAGAHADGWYFYNATEVCMYGGAFGLQNAIDGQKCKGMPRKVWRMLGGLQWDTVI